MPRPRTIRKPDARPLTGAITRELQGHVDPDYLRSIQSFFKHGIRARGVRTPQVRAISRTCYARVKGLSKDGVFSLCGQLLDTGYVEDRTIAFDWAWRMRRLFDASDFVRFERWLEKHCTDWGGIDDLCCHALGHLLYTFPEHLPRLRLWARSPKWHMRRASAVALIYSVRRGQHLDEVYAITDILLEDHEDLVQKGYGWLLKEASREFPDEVFQYVMDHKAAMPRTALRYAIEKLPAAKRKLAMAK